MQLFRSKIFNLALSNYRALRIYFFAKYTRFFGVICPHLVGVAVGGEETLATRLIFPSTVKI